MGLGGDGGGVEKWRLKLTSANTEVEVENELGNNDIAVATNNVASRLPVCQPTGTLTACA